MDSVAYHEANRRGGGPDGSENQRKSEKGGFSDAAVDGVFDVYIYVCSCEMAWNKRRGRRRLYIYCISVLVSVRSVWIY